MLNREGIVALIKEILIKNEIKIPPVISGSDPIRDLGINSLAFIELIFELEERLHITITLEDPSSIQTVDGLISKIESCLIEQHKN